MLRKAPRRNHNHIYLHIFTFFAIFGQEDFRRGGHMAQPTGINRRGKVNGFRPRLYLNKGNALSAPRDDIHLTTRGFYAHAHNPPSFQAQEPSGKRLPAPSALFGGSAVHFAFNSVARA
jgi:hypothetical protein